MTERQSARMSKITDDGLTRTDLCNFWHPDTLLLRTERQSARMSKITIDGCYHPVWPRMLYSCTHMATVGGQRDLSYLPIHVSCSSIRRCMSRASSPATDGFTYMLAPKKLAVRKFIQSVSQNTVSHVNQLTTALTYFTTPMERFESVNCDRQ